MFRKDHKNQQRMNSLIVISTRGYIPGEGKHYTYPRLVFLSEMLYCLLLETGYRSKQPVA